MTNIFGIVSIPMHHVIGAGIANADVGVRSNEVYHAAATWPQLPVSLCLDEVLRTADL